MAKSSERSSKPKRKWLRYLIMLLFGGGSGLGGWTFKDHPIAQKIYTRLTGEEAPDGPVTKEQAVKVVTSVLARVDAYKKPGEFEVKVTSLKLDAGQFKQGHTASIQARLLRIDDEGHEVVVWDSKTVGENVVKVGTSDLEFNWKARPIAVAWKPGEDFAFEIWDRKGLLDRRYFEWASKGDETFPLRSGSYVLSRVEGKTTSAAKGCQIVLESKPLPAKESARSVASDSKGTESSRIR